MKWSKYQLAIFEDVAKGEGHTVVEALAGSGKTSSIIEALKYIPANLSWLLVAFNKRIADELKLRAPTGGEVSTLHSLGLKSIGKTFRKISVDTSKTDNILIQLLGTKDETKELRYQLAQAVSLAKGYLAHTATEIDEILDSHDIEPLEIERDEFINHILFVLDIAKKKTSIVDFDDMIWFPNVLKLDIPKFDRVFVDEAQDLNKAQIEFVLQTVRGKAKTKRSKAPGRITAIGDPHQAIYQWRGADSDAIGRIRKTLGAKTLGLPVTYRCPLTVVKEAQKIVPALEPSPTAIEGKIDYISYEEMYKLAKPGCFILSRVNAPLVTLALGFIKRGIPANIQGRDIGENLVQLINRSKAKTIESFVDYVERWKKKECQRLMARNRDTTLVIDKAECLFALAEGADSVRELKSNIERLFSDTDDSKKVILSTTHKAKGLERDTVFMLTNTYRYSGGEESNIRYVAITRAKKELYFVKSKLDKKE